MKPLPGPPYSLEELESHSGFPQRRIRSWIAQGLLPAPHAKGRAAFYGEEHLDRLLFIGRFQEKLGSSRVPHGFLREVFEAIESGEDPDVLRRVARGEEELQLAGFGSLAPSPPLFSCAEAMEEVEPAAPRPLPTPRPGGRSAEAPWTTIEIRDGLELRLRGDDPERMAWLARMARKLREWADE